MKLYSHIKNYFRYRLDFSNKNIILFFIFALLIQITRNPYQIFNPSLYAEDGGWISLLINYGLFFTLENGRPEYPIYLPIILDWIALVFNKLVFGFNLSYLPIFVAFTSYFFIASNSFLAIVVVLKISNSKVAALMVGILVLLIPLSEVNTTIGHNLQWGHVVPFTSCMLFIVRDKFRYPILHDFIQVILCLTLPVCLINGVIFIFIYVMSFKYIDGCLIFNIKKSFVQCKKYIPILILVVFSGIFLIFHIKRGTNTSGSTDPLAWAHFIEFAIYRPFLFYLFGFYTNKLNNVIVIGLFILIYILPAIFTKFFMRFNKSIIFILICFLSYLVIFCIARGGIAKILNYSDTFIHFYYYGLSMYAIVILGLIYSGFKKHLPFIAVLIIISQISINYRYIFQIDRSQPVNIGLRDSIFESYRIQCGNFNCTESGGDIYYINANPHPSKIHLPKIYIERTVNK